MLARGHKYGPRDSEVHANDQGPIFPYGPEKPVNIWYITWPTNLHSLLFQGRSGLQWVTNESRKEKYLYKKSLLAYSLTLKYSNQSTSNIDNTR